MRHIGAPERTQVVVTELRVGLVLAEVDLHDRRDVVGNLKPAAAEQRVALQRDLHHARRVDLDELVLNAGRRRHLLLLVVDAILPKHHIVAHRAVEAVRAVGLELPQRAGPIEIREELLAGRDAGVGAGATRHQIVRDGLIRQVAGLGHVRRFGRREKVGTDRPILPDRALPIAIARPDFATRRVFEAHEHVALVVGEVRAVHARDSHLLAVAFHRLAVAHVEVDALVVLLQDEVHDAGHRVGAVHRRCAARDRLDSRDGGRRNRVDADRAERVHWHAAAAIDQNEVTVRAEAAQAQGRRTRSVRRARLHVRGRERRDGRHELRHLVHDRLEADRHRVVERVFLDREDRAVRFEIAADDARPGDGDFF